MSNYGLKMAQTGYDVLTASDKNLAFSSAFNVFKLSLEISGSESVRKVTGQLKIIFPNPLLPLLLVF